MVLGVICGVLGVANVVYGSLVIFNHIKRERREVERPVVVSPRITGAETKLLFMGTTFWGRRINKLARASELGVRYPFSQLETLGRESYDAWITGLECPITENGHTDYNEDRLLKFNCDPDYLPEAKRWISAVNLGTNHTDNWGAEGFEETKRNLSEAGIQYFGHYDYGNATENCAVVVLPMRVAYDDGGERTMQLPFGMCSAHGVFGVPTGMAVANIERYAKYLPTIVSPHMGKEYMAGADNLRQNLYRRMIDLGAEMVLADHPHWIQNAEAYGGRLIVYSMGNFMFDQRQKETTRSAAIEAVGSLDSEVDFEAWDKLGKACLLERAGCFERIAETGLEKPELRWRFSYQGTTSFEGAIPRRASEIEQVEIGQRLDWQRVMEALGQE